MTALHPRDKSDNNELIYEQTCEKDKLETWVYIAMWYWVTSWISSVFDKDSYSKREGGNKHFAISLIFPSQANRKSALSKTWCDRKCRSPIGSINSCTSESCLQLWVDNFLIRLSLVVFPLGFPYCTSTVCAVVLSTPTICLLFLLFFWHAPQERNKLLQTLFTQYLFSCH